ncbi:carbon storage regulator [Peribacillus sp. TH24]|uniref:carbon storage regulator n=1 Tax=Peribacillus sp. TH24 TaxID=2798483 RepID=UPI00191149AA|nr:carbon storage regulator [Peribacillus sp. TH24]MBK5447042.1 carbon storage regulator [Peribacillus sp. TH24]MBK5447073.1 carbon storage regulator [Peribacillus sp. TH24]
MALVIGRKPGQSVYIGDDIKITVVLTDNEMLRLKIEAPKDIKIVREELMGNNPE